MIVGEGSGSSSPSPCFTSDSRTEVLSYRSSRAASEAPHRSCSSLYVAEKTQRRSKVMDEREMCAGKCLDGWEPNTAQFGNGNRVTLEKRTPSSVGGAKTRRGGRGGRSAKAKLGNHAFTGHSANLRPYAAAWDSRLKSPEWFLNNIENECNTCKLPTTSASGPFSLSQKVYYPFGQQEVGYRPDGFQHDDEAVECAEYEATAEMMAATKEIGDMRSVVRQANDSIPSRISTMAISILPDPVPCSSALAIAVGDVNGRVNYCELPCGSVRVSHSCSQTVRNTTSALSAASHNAADLRASSASTSLASTSPSLDLGGVGFQRSLLRRHTHQAYVREMDCLTSVSISQTVKCLAFLKYRRSPSTVSYLTSNDCVIKLFRIQREGFSPFHAFPQMESIVGRHLVNSEYFPRTSPPPLILPVRVFSGCHNNPVQGISVCADEQSFLSADDLEVFWWNFESSATSKGSRIADLKPISGCMEDVSELITTAKFHPTHNSLFLLGRSSGLTAVGDLRESATGARRRYSMCMQVRPSTVCGPVLEEYGDILSSVSDADFVGSSHVVTRDYLSLQLWDTRQTSEPCAVAPLMPYLVPRLEALYDMDKIFDRFPVAVDHISGTVVTGLYDGAAAVWQPLQGGQCNTKDALTFYRPDPQLLLCEVENGSQVTYELLEASFAQRWEASTLSRVSRTGYPQALTPEPVDNKVMSVSISEGGRRFAMSLKDGRSVFLFER